MMILASSKEMKKVGTHALMKEFGIEIIALLIIVI